MLTDSDGVPIRSGLCLGCSSTLYWFRDRLRCSNKDANIKQCPTKACNRRHSLSPGEKPLKILRMIPDTDACFGKEYDPESDRCSICYRSGCGCSYDTKRYHEKEVKL